MSENERLREGRAELGRGEFSRALLNSPACQRANPAERTIAAIEYPIHVRVRKQRTSGQSKLVKR